MASKWKTECKPVEVHLENLHHHPAALHAYAHTHFPLLVDDANKLLFSKMSSEPASKKAKSTSAKSLSGTWIEGEMGPGTNVVHHGVSPWYVLCSPSVSPREVLIGRTLTPPPIESAHRSRKFSCTETSPIGLDAILTSKIFLLFLISFASFL